MRCNDGGYLNAVGVVVGVYLDDSGAELDSDGVGTVTHELLFSELVKDAGLS